MGYPIREGWEFEHNGGGNFAFIRDFTTQNGDVLMVFVNEEGAGIPMTDDETAYKTKEEYKEDYTQEWLTIIDYDYEDDSYFGCEDATFDFFSDEQLKEIYETINTIDKWIQS